jgi:hypothetical protein
MYCILQNTIFLPKFYIGCPYWGYILTPSKFLDSHNAILEVNEFEENKKTGRPFFLQRYLDSKMSHIILMDFLDRCWNIICGAGNVADFYQNRYNSEIIS